METLEIKSSSSLLTSRPDSRSAGVYVYEINCRQFIASHKSWLKNGAAREQPLAVLTTAFERIWMTRAEAEEIAAAIQGSHSPVVLGGTRKAM